MTWSNATKYLLAKIARTAHITREDAGCQELFKTTHPGVYIYNFSNLWYNLIMENAIEIATHLGFDATSAKPFGSGHINDTFKVETNSGPVILQKINTDIFKDADGMMDNIKKVTDYLSSIGKTTYKVLAYEKPWRVLSFIDGAHSVDVIEDPAQAFTAGAAFGAFQNDLANFKAKDLVETIPKFHNTL